MGAFEVKVEGLDKAVASFNKYPRIAEPILQRAIEASAAELQKNATRNTVPWKTGNLVQSFGRGTVIGRLTAKIGPMANYAVYVHEGTRPHVIVPKNKKALADRRSGTFFGKKVNHPGTAPNKFMPRILDKAKSKMESHFARACQLILEQLAKN